MLALALPASGTATMRRNIADAAAAHPATIRIGVVTAVSGPHASEGRATRLGYEFWRRWVNAHGGLRIGERRYPVEFVERDDESNPLLTAQLTERIINEEQVEFLLGPYGSAETLAAAAIAERKHVPLVTGTAASEKIYEQGYRYVFGVMSPARRYFRSVIDFAMQSDPQIRTVAVIASSDTFSLEAQQGALQRAHDRGLHVVDTGVYRADQRDFRELSASLAASQPDLILHAGHARESIAFTRSLYDGGVHARAYGQAVGAEFPTFAHALAALSDDTLSAAQWSGNIRSRGNGAYFCVSAPVYAAQFAQFAKQAAASESASASAAGVALSLALAHVGSRNPELVRASLSHLRARTFYGDIAFDARGLNITKPMYVNQLEIDRLHLVYPRRLARVAPVVPARDWNDR